MLPVPSCAPENTEMDVGTYTNGFSLNRSDPNSAVPVKYVEMDLNIKFHQLMSYSAWITCLFGAGKGSKKYVWY